VYATLLAVHSVLRWAVLVGGVLALVRAWRGDGTGRAGTIFVGLLDLQVLLGIVMYVTVSAFTKAALADMGSAMKDHTLRFWAVEHPTAMLVGLVLVHVGRVVERRAGADATKKRRATILLTLGLVAIVVGIPWPFFPYGRPLFPGFT
jgi:hypothetical protein